MLGAPPCVLRSFTRQTPDDTETTEMAKMARDPGGTSHPDPHTHTSRLRVARPSSASPAHTQSPRNRGRSSSAAGVHSRRLVAACVAAHRACPCAMPDAATPPRTAVHVGHRRTLVPCRTVCCFCFSCAARSLATTERAACASTLGWPTLGWLKRSCTTRRRWSRGAA